MKLFVYEHITSGAFAGQPLPEGLAHEGYQMLMAALQDSHQTPACTLITQYDSRLKLPDLFKLNSHYISYPVKSQQDHQLIWESCLDQCDRVLIIAPETESCLLKLQQQAQVAGKHYLGSTPEAIKVTSNKLNCYRALMSESIPTIKTTLAAEYIQAPFTHPTGYIAKPIDGAGCTDTFFFKTSQSLNQHLNLLTPQQQAKTIIQPYIDGTSASLCVLTTSQGSELLSINQQHITIEQNQLSLSACTINADHADLPSLKQAEILVQAVQNLIPGLTGFWGMDTLFHHDQHLIVDINPRLTSTYCALNTELAINPIQRLLMTHTTNAPSTAIKQQHRVTIGS